jgi:hypothetical protein
LHPGACRPPRASRPKSFLRPPTFAVCRTTFHVDVVGALRAPVIASRSLLASWAGYVCRSEIPKGLEAEKPKHARTRRYHQPREAPDPGG